jgi:hypothetical protein
VTYLQRLTKDIWIYLSLHSKLWNKIPTLDSGWIWWHFVAQCPKTSISVFPVVTTQASVIAGCTRISCISVTPGPEPPRRLLLQYLDLTDCHAVEDGGLRVIVRNCPQLAYLYLRRCVQITGEAWSQSTSDSDTSDWAKYVGNIFRYPSASNRNEHQESSWGVKGGRRVRLTTYRHLWADCLENVGASTPHNPMGLHGLLQG